MAPTSSNAESYWFYVMVLSFVYVNRVIVHPCLLLLMAFSYEEQPVITILVVLACSFAATSERIPYHISILLGQAWMLALLDGHPARIHNVLGLHRKAFLELVETLRSMGYTDSCHITLEEQLGIILSTC